MEKYYKNRQETAWYNFEPVNKTGLVEITKAEWLAHLSSIAPREQTAEDAAIAQKKQEIVALKKNLADTDYQAIKYAEGLITKADYAEIKAQRQAWRDRINELEAELNSEEN